jgi:pyruvate/2-oxoglutarate/acetoin dehydrogenase E1 component
VLRSGRDVTVVATLLMADRALQAADELAGEGVDVEVIDPQWLRPFDHSLVASSVERTGRLVVVEEQVHAGGWGATLISRLTLAGVTFETPPRVVGLPDDVLIPYSPSLEDAIIPSVAVIADAVRPLA